MEKEILKLNKSTVQAVAAYLSERPYKEVADIANVLIFEANNQKMFDEVARHEGPDKTAE